jgi:FtsZ-interacting cell division protein ZipA
MSQATLLWGVFAIIVACGIASAVVEALWAQEEKKAEAEKSAKRSSRTSRDAHEEAVDRPRPAARTRHQPAFAGIDLPVPAAFFSEERNSDLTATLAAEPELPPSRNLRQADRDTFFEEAEERERSAQMLRSDERRDYSNMPT